MLRTCADSEYRYMTSFELFQGRNPDSQKNQSENIVLSLVKPFYNTGRNVFTDRFYTSIPLCIELFKKKLSLVGTLNNIRKYLPKEAVSNLKNINLENELSASDENKKEKATRRRLNKREQYDSKFFFCKLNDLKMVLQSYMVKAKNCLCFLSSMHEDGKVEEKIDGKLNNKKKSDINLCYNAGKSGVTA